MFKSLLMILSGVLLAGSALAAPSATNDSAGTLRVHIDSPVNNYVTSQPRITITGTYADDGYATETIPVKQDDNHIITVVNNAKGFIDPECCVLVRGNSVGSNHASGPIEEPCCAIPTKTGPGTWEVDIPLSEGMNVITATHRLTGSTAVATHSIRINYIIPETPDLPLLTAQSSTESNGGNNGGGSDTQSTPAVGKKKAGTVLGIKTVTNVPATVDRIFLSVFGRKPTIKESTYWKHRLRTDKKTETKLRGTMLFYKARGQTMPKQSFDLTD